MFKMLNKKNYFIYIIIFLFPLYLLSQEFVPIPKLTGRVVDLTNTLTSSEIQALSTKLENLEKEKGSQVVVLLIPTTGIETIEEYSIKVAEKWKIGRAGVDDGVILIVAKDDRKLRIEVGYGLEGAIPDVIAKRIIEEIIVPEFKKGNFYAGIDRGIDAIITLIKGEELPLRENKKDSNPSLFLIFGPAVASFILHFFINTFVAILITTLVFFVFGVFSYGFSLELLGLVFIMSILGVTWYRSKGFGSSSSGGGGSFSGGFSGGGGSFGGGGASGSW